MYSTLIILAAIASLTWLYAIVSSFFFKTLQGTGVFKTTDILSPNINSGPSNAIPNDRSMYLISRINSEATLEATNSEP
jgi:hypothetical protein